MEIEKASANRRPLKSRSTSWAAAAARIALAWGMSANTVSLLGVAISTLGAAAFIFARGEFFLFIVAAACIQLRLLANLLDGLVAVEGGRGTQTGPLFNEFPDRLEDSLFLVAAGYAAGTGWLGWLAALLAAVCAYVRLLGGTLGFRQDFGGPMAKPQRMAALTLACAAVAIEGWVRGSFVALQVGLVLISAGTALTIALRLSRLAKRLRDAG